MSSRLIGHRADPAADGRSRIFFENFEEGPDRPSGNARKGEDRGLRTVVETEEIVDVLACC